MIVRPKDEDALYDVMKKLIEGEIALEPLKKASLNEAKKYDYKNILGENSLRKIGLL